MNRAQYKARHRELRRVINSRAPDASPWKQPLAAAHHNDTVTEARIQFNALTGDRFPDWHGRSRIKALIRAQARRNARRDALRALRDAGADEAELRNARFLMEDYNWDPAGFMEKAAQMRGESA